MFLAPTSPPSKLGTENTELDALLTVSQPNSFQFNRSDELSESYRSIQHLNRTSIADQIQAQFENRNRPSNNNNNRATIYIERPRESVLNSIDMNNNLTNVSSLVVQDTTNSNNKKSTMQQNNHNPSCIDEEGSQHETLTENDKIRSNFEKIMMNATKQLVVRLLTNTV